MASAFLESRSLRREPPLELALFTAPPLFVDDGCIVNKNVYFVKPFRYAGRSGSPDRRFAWCLRAPARLGEYRQHGRLGRPFQNVDACRHGAGQHASGGQQRLALVLQQPIVGRAPRPVLEVCSFHAGSVPGQPEAVDS